MAGRSKKNNFIKDISEEKEISAVEEAFETKEIEKEAEVVKEKIEAASSPKSIFEEPKSRVRTATVKADPWLNVRNKPSANSDVIGKLFTGDEVTIYEEKDGFGKIAILDEKWVKLDFVF